jgi:DNA repair protein RecN (Recombination protein N)
MVIAALGLLCGDRVYAHQIRDGEKSGQVKGCFELNPAMIEILGLEDSRLLLARTFSRAGQSKAYLNGRPVSLKTLKAVGRQINSIHGQHDQQELLDPGIHLSLLDSFVGQKAERRRLAATYDGIRSLENQLEALSLSEKELEMKREMLTFQIHEIESAGLDDPEEKEKLKNEKEILLNGEKILSACRLICDNLYDGQDTLYDRVNQLHQQLETLAPFAPEFGRFRETAGEWPFHIEEMAGFARRFADGIDFEPARLSRVEERLAVIENLEKKYSRTAADLQNLCLQLKKELDLISGDRDRADTLKESLRHEYDRFSRRAEKLSSARKKAAGHLEKALEKELRHLAMAKAGITIHFSLESRDESPILHQGEPVAFTSTGFDVVEFLLASNPGEPYKPLSRIASGGELSRIMLALRSLGAKTRDVSTLIFDEVDAGIGGKEAAFLGLKLKDLSGSYQVICITHLPQIASCADRHYLVEKKAQSGRTVTNIRPLEEPDRIREIARMLAGRKITESSLAHARSLLAGGGSRAP